MGPLLSSCWNFCFFCFSWCLSMFGASSGLAVFLIPVNVLWSQSQQTNLHRHQKKQNYFTSQAPKKTKLLYFEWSPHDIYRFVTGKASGILSDISSIWHSIWHIFWHISWHSIWHSIWHSFWHSIWHISWHFIWHIFWHSIWHIFWHTFCQSMWHIFWHSIWHSIWHIFWHSICPLRSSSAHWAGEVPGWGPAVHTALGKSQVEVQRCTLGWAGPRLRSSGAHWAETVSGWGPAVHTELEVQRCTLSWAGPRLRSQCTLS